MVIKNINLFPILLRKTWSGCHKSELKNVTPGPLHARSKHDKFV